MLKNTIFIEHFVMLYKYKTGVLGNMIYSHCPYSWWSNQFQYYYLFLFLFFLYCFCLYIYLYVSALVFIGCICILLKHNNLIFIFKNTQQVNFHLLLKADLKWFINYYLMEKNNNPTYYYRCRFYFSSYFLNIWLANIDSFSHLNVQIIKNLLVHLLYTYFYKNKKIKI